MPRFKNLQVDLSDGKHNVGNVQTNEEVSMPSKQYEVRCEHQNNKHQQYQRQNQHRFGNTFVSEAMVRLKVSAKASIKHPRQS